MPEQMIAMNFRYQPDLNIKAGIAGFENTFYANRMHHTYCTVVRATTVQWVLFFLYPEVERSIKLAKFEPYLPDTRYSC